MWALLLHSCSVHRMASSLSLQLATPLIPSVDAFCNPEADEDAHRVALNGVVLSLHRSGAGGFQSLLGGHLGPFLTNEDPKVRERGTLLCAEILARLPDLPLNSVAVTHFLAFFTARLADYPSVTPALAALRALVQHHAAELSTDSVAAVTRGVLTELPLHQAPRVMRQAALEMLAVLFQESRSLPGLTAMGGELIDLYCAAVTGEPLLMFVLEL
jgi:Dos2-interacting transcription regulator of RNA-Pol-II